MKKSSLLLFSSCLLFSSVSVLACGYWDSPKSSQEKLNEIIAGPSLPDELVSSEVPLSCQPCGEENTLCIKNKVSGTYAAGQAPIKGWFGQFYADVSGKFPDGKCANHLTTQTKVLTEAGLDPATTPIACIPTRHFKALCYSGLIPVVLKTNKPILDPSVYNLSIGDKKSSLGEYAPCVDYFRPLLSYKKVCLKASFRNYADDVVVLAQMDAATQEVKVLWNFKDEAGCEAAAAL